jgi:hypothetical protein
MKNKIKELALQAGGSHYPEVGGELLQKFADLVVKECIDAVEKTDTRHAVTTFDMGLIGSTIERSIKSIKERFSD